MFQRHAPGLALPDRILQLSESVSHKRGAASHAEDLEVVSACGSRAPGQISSENAHDDAEKEPLNEVFAETWSSVWPDDQMPNRSALEFLDHRWRLHLSMRTKRKRVHTAGSDSGAAQNISHPFVLRQLPVIPLMNRDEHMQD